MENKIKQYILTEHVWPKVSAVKDLDCELEYIRREKEKLKREGETCSQKYSKLENFYLSTILKAKELKNYFREAIIAIKTLDVPEDLRKAHRENFTYLHNKINEYNSKTNSNISNDENSDLLLDLLFEIVTTGDRGEEAKSKTSGSQKNINDIIDEKFDKMCI